MSNPIPSPQAYTFQAPTGIPGDVTRTDESNVEPAKLLQDGSPLAYPQAFGTPMVYGTGGIQAWLTSNVAVDFAGVLVREVPQIAGSIASDSSTNGGVPNPDVPNGLLVRGYVNVLCTYGTPARGGVVYIRTVTNGNGVVGAFEATADGGNSVALSATQAEWASDGTDANFNAELRVAR